jgi:hypothetical protein
MIIAFIVICNKEKERKQSEKEKKKGEIMK